MKDIIRDSTIGNILNWASNGRILPYADQIAAYSLPAKYLPTSNAAAAGVAGVKEEASAASTPPVSSSTPATLCNAEGLCSELERDLEKNADSVKLNARAVAAYPFLVTFDGPDDPDRPMAWSRNKRLFVASLILLMTCASYIGSAIYTSSIPGIEERFHVAPVVATLGLSLFVCGYGVGPMFLGPVTDVVPIGRTPVYIVCLVLYVAFQFPVIYAPNIATLLVFRFLAGFVGSPALSVTGTSMTEIFPPNVWAYAIAVWDFSAVLGPIFGPVIGGFAAQAKGWTYPIFELLWITSFTLLVLILFLPETSEKTILYRRAVRLRKLTGNALLKSQSELDAGDDPSILSSVSRNFSIGLQISADPAILLANTYLGLVYGLFYLWFESFPIVFNEIHGFNLGVAGLPYLGFVVTAVLTFVFYVYYNKLHLAKRMVNDPNFGPQTRLEIGIISGVFIPVSLLIFGWGAHSHWIVPVIGAAVYFPGISLVFQSILIFISMYVKPEYNSSVMASNCLFRSTIAASFTVFGRYFIVALGVGPACSVLAGVAAVMIPVQYWLYRKVPSLRMRSKWANHDEKITEVAH